MSSRIKTLVTQTSIPKHKEHNTVDHKGIKQLKIVKPNKMYAAMKGKEINTIWNEKGGIKLKDLPPYI